MHTVCDKLCRTAVCLSQFSEVRGSVTVWRAYTGLIHQYHRALATRLDLSLPMTALVNEIQDGLQTLASLPLKDSTVVRLKGLIVIKFMLTRFFGKFSLIYNHPRRLGWIIPLTNLISCCCTYSVLHAMLQVLHS